MRVVAPGRADVDPSDVAVPQGTTMTRIQLALAALSLGALAVVSACGASDGASPTIGASPTGTDAAEIGATASDEVDLTVTDEDGATSVDAARLEATLDAAQPASTLDAAAVDGLEYMREEEKLARDVYQTLGAQWDLGVFDNIAASEQTHTDAIVTLLDRYGIGDPARPEVGAFASPVLQDLHDRLVAKGSASLVDALTVGATIEDLDIIDIEARKTGVADIDLVYDNLMKGSRNHLRSFVDELEAQGATYVPQYLGQEAYDAIVTSPVERGG
ncbi:MAG: DUF2202 domain-containing protein, partial [Acidimicrobiia bacterium]|nr:DUF2202 domain-containing protein [Acidimicrobiia bacterium]